MEWCSLQTLKNFKASRTACVCGIFIQPRCLWIDISVGSGSGGKCDPMACGHSTLAGDVLVQGTHECSWGIQTGHSRHPAGTVVLGHKQKVAEKSMVWPAFVLGGWHWGAPGTVQHCLPHLGTVLPGVGAAPSWVDAALP